MALGGLPFIDCLISLHNRMGKIHGPGYTSCILQPLSPASAAALNNFRSASVANELGFWP